MVEYFFLVGIYSVVKGSYLIVIVDFDYYFLRFIFKIVWLYLLRVMIVGLCYVYIKKK